MTIATALLVMCAGCAGRSTGAGPVVPAALVGSGEPVVIDTLAPFFVAGETITWELSYHGINGGRAQLAVGSPGVVDGRTVIALRAEAETTGVAAAVKRIRDDVTSWIDVDGGTPLRTESAALIGDRDTQVTTEWSPGEANVKLLIREKGRERTTARRLPTARTTDPLSAILVLRRWDAPTGARATFYTLGGQRLWRTELVVDGRERVDTPLGARDAIKMSGISTRLTSSLTDDKSKKPRTFSVWFSDDAQRIPLKVVAHTELGDVTIEATSYSAP